MTKDQTNDERPLSETCLEQTQPASGPIEIAASVRKGDLAIRARRELPPGEMLADSDALSEAITKIEGGFTKKLLPRLKRELQQALDQAETKPHEGCIFTPQEKADLDDLERLLDAPDEVT